MTSKTGLIGTALPRTELHRLLAGRGRYTDDIRLPRMLHVAFVRILLRRHADGDTDAMVRREARGNSRRASRDLDDRHVLCGHAIQSLVQVVIDARRNIAQSRAARVEAATMWCLQTTFMSSEPFSNGVRASSIRPDLLA